MTLAEIRTMRQNCRAKLEDLLTRTSSREMSTEENQMFTDLKAEGERLASLESRYAVLESFDKPGTESTNRRPIVTNGNEAKLKALDFAFRNGHFQDGKQAADVPLQIQQSPVDAASAAAVPTDFAFVDATGTFDVAAALGLTEYPRTSSNPLQITIHGAATATGKYVEGTAPTESSIPTFKDVNLGGARYQNLTKTSLESINNVAFNVVQAVTRSLVTGQLEQQNADFGAALKAACAANTNCLVESGTTNDAYYTLAALISKLPAIFQGPNNKFLLSSADLLSCLNARDDQNRPLLNFTAGTLLGKPFVVSEDVDRVYYGNWSFGGFRSRTPLYVSVLRELYAQSGHVGYSSYQWADWAFYSELTTLTKQPVLFSHLGAAGA